MNTNQSDEDFDHDFSFFMEYITKMSAQARLAYKPMGDFVREFA